MLLNITPDHLGWHKTHVNYALAKIDLFRNMDESDLAIVNVEDEGISAFADRVFVPGRRVLSLGLSDARSSRVIRSPRRASSIRASPCISTSRPIIWGGTRRI